LQREKGKDEAPEKEKERIYLNKQKGEENSPFMGNRKGEEGNPKSHPTIKEKPNRKKPNVISSI